MTKRHLGVNDFTAGVIHTYCGQSLSIDSNNRKAEWNLCRECVKKELGRLGPRDRWRYIQEVESNFQKGRMQQAQHVRNGTIQGHTPGSNVYGYKWPLYENAKLCVWCGGDFIPMHKRWKVTVEHIIPHHEWNKHKQTKKENGKITASHAICNQRRGTQIDWVPHTYPHSMPQSQRDWLAQASIIWESDMATSGGCLDAEDFIL